MKISELIGADLDYWVARAMGWRISMPSINSSAVWVEWERKCQCDIWSPSTNWAQGGSIIERKEIHLIFFSRWPVQDAWTGHIDNTSNEQTAPCGPTQSGPTPLIAAMRCYVASQFGDEVPDA